jgi:hypothetical protein
VAALQTRCCLSTLELSSINKIAFCLSKRELCIGCC